MATSQPSVQRVLPEGYTFLNTKTFISQKAKDAIIGLLAQADQRDPDNFGMHIYNDYFNYAVLQLIHDKLTALHGQIVKEQYDEAYYSLEALTIFQDICSMWPMLDDGDQVIATDKAYGACLMEVLRKIKAQNKLDTAHFPSLETLLRGAAEWGENIIGIGGKSNYYVVCKGIGKRLFADKSEEDKALETARREEWIASLPEDEKRAARKAIEEPDDDEEDSEEEGEEWWQGEANEGDNDRNYDLAKVWKDYKKCLSRVPRLPLRGPPEWDISKWSEEEKAPFSLGRYDGSDSDNW
ncbi:hypothetical protein OE88DRAFT_1804427 [Heliocybe sulcata]|uniref:Uncharacterized protein n=1 Tax=Heliocybe sulcata TaxID=5364 RepID=A0A5C3NE50_9AGAM|nr:hypothetical protein OE88DRAFT_1804427 [Heliocybe sulcata]